MDSSLAQRADAPARSVERRHTALAQANQVRIQRAALKAQLKRGDLDRQRGELIQALDK
jgi:hypothetical protein